MSVPLSYRTAPILAAMTSGKTLVVGIGDSLFCQTASPRVVGGAIRRWNVNFAGLLIPYIGSATDGHSSSANTGNWSNAAPLPGQNFADGSTNRWPMQIREMTGTSNMANNSLLIGHSLKNLSEYLNGDWTKNNPLRARWIYRRATTNAPDVNRTVTRQGSTYTANVATDTSGATSFQYADSNFPTANNTSNDPSFYIFNGVGSQDETGKTFYPVGCWMESTGLDGIRLCTIAQGGDTTIKHLDPTVDAAGEYTDANLATFFTFADATLRDKVVLLIQLGQNTAATGEQGSYATYKAHLEAVIDRYVGVLTGLGVTNYLVCLRATWQTNTEAQAQYDLIAQACYDISLARAYVGFVNLYQLINNAHGAYATWTATYQSDGAHQTQAGTEEFERLFWGELASPTPTSRPSTVLRCGGIRIGL